MKNIFLILVLAVLTACNSSDKNTNEIWIYTSLYKDTIAELTPKLKKAFPDTKINWFQAGSEEIATKVNAEIISGETQADILISSDRFWYEEMANNKKLLSYKPKNAEKIDSTLVHSDSKYHTLSIPVMVLSYNKEFVSSPPKTFKELSDPKWKDKFTTGSPLASGTNFTTMAMIQNSYGWEYFEKLKQNNTIAQGGNSAVVRRMQSGERPVGWVLLENLLRFQGKDNRLQIIYPKDGVVTHANVLALTKKNTQKEKAKKIADYLFSKEGQISMTNSYMYAPTGLVPAPKGAPELNKLLENSFKWSPDFISKVVSSRAQLKEKYTEIMFQ